MNEVSGKDLFNSEHESYRRVDQYCLGKSTCAGCDPNCPANTDKPKPITPPATLLEENTAFEKVFPFTAKHHIIFDVDVVKWDNIYPFLSDLRFAYNLDMSATKIKIAEFEVEIEKLKYENQNLKESKKDLNDQIKKLNEFIEEQKLYIKFKI